MMVFVFLVRALLLWLVCGLAACIMAVVAQGKCKKSDLTDLMGLALCGPMALIAVFALLIQEKFKKWEKDDTVIWQRKANNDDKGSKHADTEE